jgi:hypothetical protein
MNDQLVDMYYNSATGTFTVDQGLRVVREQDLTLAQSNQYRALANETSLTDYDIYMLYQYYIKKYKGTLLLREWVNTPLKQVWPDLPSDGFAITNLMVDAYNYLDVQPVERFESNTANRRFEWGDYVMIFIVVVMWYIVLSHAE